MHEVALMELDKHLIGRWAVPALAPLVNDIKLSTLNVDLQNGDPGMIQAPQHALDTQDRDGDDSALLGLVAELHDGIAILITRRQLQCEIAISGSKANRMKGKAVGSTALLDEVEGGRGGVPAMMDGSIIVDHSAVPLNVAAHADGIHECTAEAIGRERLAQNPTAIGVAQALGRAAVERYRGRGEATESAETEQEKQGEDEKEE